MPLTKEPKILSVSQIRRFSPCVAEVHRMESQATDVPVQFEELVQDALLRLYDLACLQTHRLATVGGVAEASPIARGKYVRQALLDTIAALHPGHGVASSSRAWRCYRILQLRYVAGNEVAEVLNEANLSKRQYYREHRAALSAVASSLWERWRVSERWPTLVESGHHVRPDSDELARREAAHLQSGDVACSIDPAEVLRGVYDSLRPLCERKRVRLHVEMSQGLPAVRGERVALRQALLAVLTHLLHFVEGTVVVSAVHTAGYLDVSISSQSPAWPDPEHLGVEEGRPFVEALRGSLSYQPPSPGSGRWVVNLRFPAGDRPALLVVDNNRDFLTLVQRYLAVEDWEVVGVSDADQSFGVARQWRPQVIILDVIMPGRDGWEVLEQLRTAEPTRDIPVIVCSVLREPEMAVALGAVAYLQKPVSQHQLIEALRTHAPGDREGR